MLSLAVTVIGTILLSKTYGRSTEVFYDYLLPNTLLWAITVFLFIKKWSGALKANEKTEKALKMLAKSSFGAYLIHVFVYNIFLKIGFAPTICSSFVAIPLLSITTWIVSMIISIILSKIPLLGEYIV